MEVGTMLLLVGAILAGSIVVAFGAARIGVPSLVAFLVLGMLLGSDGPGGIEFYDAELARTVGIVGLAAILYEGGLSTSWESGPPAQPSAIAPPNRTIAPVNRVRRPMVSSFAKKMHNVAERGRTAEPGPAAIAQGREEQVR